MKNGSDRQISARQLGALALTAAGLPIFRLCCRISWPWVLLGGLASAGTLSALTAAARRHCICGGAQQARRVPGALIFSAGALLAAWESTYAFPETAGNLLTAALVLALAGAAAVRGPVAVGRCATVLLWVTGVLYGTVLIFSLRSLRVEWLVPAGAPTDSLRVWAALTVPGAALCFGVGLPPERRLPCWPWWAAAGLAAAASVVTGGILSPALAREPEAFRTLARGVSVLGVVRRFEALVNGAMLMSGFCLCGLYLSAAKNALKIREKKREKKFEKSQKKC